MTFVESVKTCYRKFFNWNGRATRSEYWWFHLFIFLLSLPFLLAVSQTPKGVSLPIFWVLYICVFMVGTLIPSWMVSVRRLHDINRTGWWYLIINIPYVGLVLLWFFLQPSKDPNNYDEKIFIASTTNKSVP